MLGGFLDKTKTSMEESFIASAFPEFLAILHAAAGVKMVNQDGLLIFDGILRRISNFLMAYHATIQKKRS